MIVLSALMTGALELIIVGGLLLKVLNHLLKYACTSMCRSVTLFFAILLCQFSSIILFTFRANPPGCYYSDCRFEAARLCGARGLARHERATERELDKGQANTDLPLVWPDFWPLSIRLGQWIFSLFLPNK